MCSQSDSSDRRMTPCRRSTRSARQWAGVMSQGASVSWDFSRRRRVTAQNASVRSSPSAGLAAAWS